GILAFEQRAAEFAGDAAAEADDAFVKFFEQGPVDAGFEIEAFQIGFGSHFDEVAKAGAILGQERKVVAVFFERAALAFVPAFGGDIGLVAENWIDAGFLGGLIELERAVEVAVIGDRQGVHAERFGAADEFIDRTGAVEEAVVTVAMQVNEGERAHEI